MFLRLAVHLLLWPHDQERKPGGMQDTLGDAAQGPAVQATIPMRCHRDYMRAAGIGSIACNQGFAICEALKSYPKTTIMLILG